MYNRREKIRTAPTSADTITAAVEAWYRDIQETEQPSDVLLIGDRNTTVHQLNQQARARLTRDGRLTGPAVVTSDRTFQRGDRIVCLKNRSRVGVLNGDLGSVTAVDIEQRNVTVRLDRTGHPVTIPSWYLDEDNLDWGYALTGHKAQGATASRVHTVAGGSVDREWIYVAMSRGREANTIYLTDPDRGGDACTHVAHQYPDRLYALMTALGRTASQPAALDSGRGPQTLTDSELEHRIADLEASVGEIDLPRWPTVHRAGLSTRSANVQRTPADEESGMPSSTPRVVSDSSTVSPTTSRDSWVHLHVSVTPYSGQDGL